MKILMKGTKKEEEELKKKKKNHTDKTKMKTAVLFMYFNNILYKNKS